MSNAKRKELKDTGRGAVGKAAVVGVKDRKTNKVTARHVARTDTPHLAGFVAEKTKFGSKVYTNEAKAYNVLKPWYDHETVNHSVSEYVRDQAGIPTGSSHSGAFSSGRTRASTTSSARSTCNAT